MDSGFNQKFIEGGVWLTLSSFLIRAVGFFSVFIVLSNTEVKDYGLYKLVLAAFAFLTGFFFSGFDNLVISDLARERGEGRMDRVKRLFLEYSGVKLLIGAILFLAAFFGAPLLGRFVDPEVMQFLPLVSILFIFYALERPLNYLFNTYLKFKYLALYTLVEEIGKLGLILIFVFFLEMGAKGIIIADVFSSGIAFVALLPVGVILLKDLLRYEISVEKMLLPIIRLHGKWGIATRYLDEIKKSIRPWLIKYFVGIEAVGLYSMAEGIYGQITNLFPLSNILLPLLPGEIGNHKKIREILVLGLKFGTPFFILLGASASVAVTILVHLLFPNYIPALTIFYIMLGHLLIAAFANVLTAILYAERQQRAQFAITAVTIAFMAATGALMLYSFGIIGIAFEFLLTAFFYTALRARFIFRMRPEFRFSLVETIFWRKADLDIIRRSVKIALYNFTKII